MDDLTTWLRAQLDDDELTARAVEGNGSWDVPSTGVVQLGGVKGMEGLVPTSRNVAYHMAEHDPARVLAEVDAKRRIMAIHNRRADVFPGNAGGTFDNCCDGCGYEGICDDPVTENINDCPILHALALPYADRDGYREEWTP